MKTIDSLIAETDASAFYENLSEADWLVTGLLLICLILLWEMCKTSADWNLSPIRLEGLFFAYYMQITAKAELKTCSQFCRSFFRRSEWNSLVYIF